MALLLIKHAIADFLLQTAHQRTTKGIYGASGGLVVETNTGAGTLVRMRIPKSQPRHELAMDAGGART